MLHSNLITERVSTPIRLTPSAAAFRSTTGSADKVPQPNQPGLTSSRSWISGGVGSGGGIIPSSSGMYSTTIEAAAIRGKTELYSK